MAKVSAFRKISIGVGVLIAIGIIGSTVGNAYMLTEGVSGDKRITVSAETQNQIEGSLVGDKKEGIFSVGDGQFVFAERR